MNYPVLTYGTLRPGQSNYALLRGHTVHESTVRVEGFDMYAHRGYPYVIDGEGTIEATLNYIHPENYDAVLTELDFLEGYHGDKYAHNHYNRILTSVQISDVETVIAWMYVARNPEIVERAKQLIHVPTGSWIDFRFAYETVMNSGR